MINQWVTSIGRAAGALAAVISLAGPLPASAQSPDAFPSRTIRLVVPQTAGTGGDLAARLMAEQFKLDLGQSVVVDNRAGANGMIAMAYLAKQPPDGYTLLLAGVSQMSFNAHLYKEDAFDSTKDFAYVSPTVEVPFVLVASKKSGIRTLQDTIALSKTKPGGVFFASGGVGNSTHLAPVMLALRADMPSTHVPYSGSSGALMSVVSGETDIMVSPLPIALPHITSGALTPVAMFSSRRAKQLPDVATLKELGLDVPEMPGWYALIAPAGIDPKVAKVLEASAAKMFADPHVIERLYGQGMSVVGGTAEQARARGLNDSKTWGELIRTQNIKPD